MLNANREMKETWDSSFQEQIKLQAYNTSPVEALIRSASYYFRNRFSPEQMRNLHFLELGCGAGPNLMWLAQRGVQVSGLDISPVALELCRAQFQKSEFSHSLRELVEGSVDQTPFDDESFDGIFEACVFQHLNKDQRIKAFSEVKRILKPGGLFVGYMLDTGHTVYQLNKDKAQKDDPGSLLLEDGKSKVYLTNIGLSHFFTKAEYEDLLSGFSVIDPCLTTYYLPKSEAIKRGYKDYLQSMWTVYAIK